MLLQKNLQSIQNQTRFEDFMVEIDDGDFDIVLLAETWRAEKEEFYKTNFEDPTPHHNLDGEPPTLSDLLAQLPPDPADSSRLPPHPP